MREALPVIRSHPFRPTRVLAGALAVGLLFAPALSAQETPAPEASDTGGGAHRVQVPTPSAAETPAEPLTPPVAEVPPGLGLADMIAPAGVELSVALTANAPRDPADRIRIAQPGAGPEDASGGEALVAIEGPVSIDAPVVPGTWELRYVAQGEGGPQVLETSVLTIVDAEYKSPRNRAAAQP